MPLYVFHLGVYLLILWHIWLFTAGATGSGSSSYGLMAGHIATGMAFIGGAGMLAQRILNRELRAHYPLSHYLKWLLILALLVQGFLGVFIYFGNDVSGVVAYVSKQLSFDWAYKMDSPPIPSLHVILASVWLLYLPFSHVFRLVFRYYHELRWDCAKRTPGSSLEKKIAENLARPVTWSARHIGEPRTWAGLAEVDPQGDTP
jgi:nitrate reductase gamma subunit